MVHHHIRERVSNCQPRPLSSHTSSRGASHRFSRGPSFRTDRAHNHLHRRGGRTAGAAQGGGPRGDDRDGCCILTRRLSCCFGAHSFCVSSSEHSSCFWVLVLHHIRDFLSKLLVLHHPLIVGNNGDEDGDHVHVGRVRSRTGISHRLCPCPAIVSVLSRTVAVPRWSRQRSVRRALASAPRAAGAAPWTGQTPSSAASVESGFHNMILQWRRLLGAASGEQVLVLGATNRCDADRAPALPCIMIPIAEATTPCLYMACPGVCTHATGCACIAHCVCVTGNGAVFLTAGGPL